LNRKNQLGLVRLEEEAKKHGAVSRRWNTSNGNKALPRIDFETKHT
jgi:hypothetical protein